MDSLTTRDGLRLHARLWPCAAARGTVLIVHGLGEHSGRYAHVAARLNTWGWQVVGYDQRGHGRSDGARGRLRQGDDLLCDLALVIDAVRASCAAPLLLLGHSMGGAVSAHFVGEGTQARPAAWWRPVDALVLSSPALDPGLSLPQRLLACVLGALAPDLQIDNRRDPYWVARDPEVVSAYRADPLVHSRVTARLVRFLIGGGDYALSCAQRWHTPTLLLYAGSDRLVSPAASARFARSAPSGRVTSHRFATMYHEILNDPQQDEVFEVLRRWLDAYIAPSQTTSR